MIANKSKSNKSHTDVRFSRFLGIIIILLSHAPLIYAVQQIIYLKGDFFQGTNFIFPTIAFVVGLFIIAAGMSHTKRRYLRIDRDSKMLMISYGIGSWSKKHPYDSIHFDGKIFQIEKNGVKKKIGFVKYACNRKDLKSLILNLKEPT